MMALKGVLQHHKVKIDRTFKPDFGKKENVAGRFEVTACRQLLECSSFARLYDQPRTPFKAQAASSRS